MEITKQPHAALLASPGMGHLIPFLELGKRLAIHHGFQVTIFVVDTITAANDSNTTQTKLLDNNNLINVVTIPIDVSNMIDSNTSILTSLIVTMHESLPILRSKISDMKVRPTIFIVDIFGTEALDAVAKEFNMLRYVFVTTNAWFLALTLYIPSVEKVVKGENRIALPDPVRIPGCKPVRLDGTLSMVQEQEGEDYGKRMALGMLTADGIMVNTWDDLERTTIQAFREDEELTRIVKVPVYPVGPLVRPVRSPGLKSGVLEWLEKQPTESVLYVSFGSGGTLSAKQTLELAWGLELSQQRFVWVLRAPTDTSGSGAFFSVGENSDCPLDFLPDGFLTRTQNVGLVVPMWAPQTEILNHRSIGGFLSHCGWNSTLESIINGVPMIAWPLYAEQSMNATMLTEELEVAVGPTVLPSAELVGREEIAKMVRKIMINEEGMAIRERAKELKCSAEGAIIKGGSSYDALSKVAKNCIRGCNFNY